MLPNARIVTARTIVPRGVVFWTLATLAVLAVGSPVPCHAQVFDDVALGQETISSDFFGVDARATSMGNTGIALSHDGSGLIYNPANLARIKRIEFRAGLSHLRSENDTRVFLNDDEFDDGLDLKKTRINGLSLTLPVPTYRGSLVFGFGVHRVNSFDRPFARHWVGLYDDGFALDSGSAIESGGIWKWTAGGAVDISPNLSVGLSAHLLRGSNDYRWSGVYAELFTGDTMETFLFVGEDQTIAIDYLGISATAGISFSVSDQVRAGLTIETPTYLRAEETATLDILYEYDTTTASYIGDIFVYDSSFLDLADYTVIRPFTFGFGLAGSFDRLNLVGDLRYTDWSQLDFDYDDAALDADESDILRFINENLTEVVSLHLGIEYLFPEHGLALRAGYFRDPLPVASEFIESQRQYFTAGFGFLIDRIMTIDFAYVHGGYELRDGKPGSFFSKYKTRRLFLTFGYRV